jgi:hypothetical protein
MSEHTHTYTHEHAHDHDGQGHEHEHTHSYTHDHEGGDKPHTHEDQPHEGHDHHHHPAPENKDQVKALLDYMFKHNSSHEDELEKMIAKLNEQGYDVQSQKVAEAKELFAKGNAALREALEGLK